MEKRKTTLSRRKFFGEAASGLAAAGFFSAPGKNRLPRKPGDSAQKQQPDQKNLIRRTLGKTGIQLPVVNMGVMNSMTPELVRRSYEIGVRHFDTAAYYQRGQNEAMVGKVIKDLNVRDKVIIGTKVYIPHAQRGMPAAQAKEFFLKTVDESLGRLQTGHIDILYVHNVGDVGYLNNTGIGEAMKLLKEQKKVRFIGFSTHMNMAECIKNAVETGFWDVILTAFNYALSDDQNLISALKSAAAKGIGLVAMKTQCSQYWYKENLPSEQLAFYNGSILQTAVLKWVLRHDFIHTAIPGYTTFEQMNESFSVAYNLDYTPEEKKFLEARNVKLAMSVCRQCAQCVPSCPMGVQIPTLMRTHMYAACYTNFFEARDALRSLPRARGLSACSACETCRAICVNGLPLGRRIRELKTIYT